MEKRAPRERAAQKQLPTRRDTAAANNQGTRSTQQAGAPTTPATAVPVQPRATVIAASPRVKIDTPNISGSISLTGARIDDVALCFP